MPFVKMLHSMSKGFIRTTFGGAGAVAGLYTSYKGSDSQAWEAAERDRESLLCSVPSSSPSASPSSPAASEATVSRNEDLDVDKGLFGYKCFRKPLSLSASSSMEVVSTVMKKTAKKSVEETPKKQGNYDKNSKHCIIKRCRRVSSSPKIDERLVQPPQRVAKKIETTETFTANDTLSRESSSASLNSYYNIVSHPYDDCSDSECSSHQCEAIFNTKALDVEPHKVYNVKEVNYQEEEDFIVVPRSTLKSADDEKEEPKLKVQQGDVKIGQMEHVAKYEEKEDIITWTSLLEEDQCSICNDVLAVPVITSCNHGFCGVCFQRLKKAAHELCPVCRNTVQENEPLDVARDGRIANLVALFVQQQERLGATDWQPSYKDWLERREQYFLSLIAKEKKLEDDSENDDDSAADFDIESELDEIVPWDFNDHFGGNGSSSSDVNFSIVAWGLLTLTAAAYCYMFCKSRVSINLRG